MLVDGETQWPRLYLLDNEEQLLLNDAVTRVPLDQPSSLDKVLIHVIVSLLFVTGVALTILNSSLGCHIVNWSYV